MIGKRGKVLLLLYGMFLVLLFLMCSTDLIIREPEKEIYQIAVIIEDVRSDQYSNFRKGMDQAAVEFNADVHFITLYEKADAIQQMELMEREQQDDADALIVVPADEERVPAKQMGIPVILLRPRRMVEAEEGSVIIEYERMGEQLALEMLEDASPNCSVLILTGQGRQSAMDNLFLEGANKVFIDNGYNVQTIVKDQSNGFRDDLENIVNWDNKKALILAVDPESLTEAAGILADNPDIEKKVQGLYGRGSTLPILNYLDRGQIAGVCVTDEFSVGYLCVRTAIRELEGDRYQPPIVMTSYYIEKKDLRDPAYEKLLFPIE